MLINMNKPINIYNIYNKHIYVGYFQNVVPINIPIMRINWWNTDHSGNGLSQWETMLHCNNISHWLTPLPEWSLCIIEGMHIWHVAAHAPNGSTDAVYSTTDLDVSQHHTCRCHVASVTTHQQASCWLRHLLHLYSNWIFTRKRVALKLNHSSKVSMMLRSCEGCKYNK